MERIKMAVPLAILVTLLLLVTGCNTQEMASSRRTRDIIVDGDSGDWQGTLSAIENKDITVGFQHDDHFFYVCLVTRDPHVSRQIMGRGLILRLGPGSNKNRRIGIKYPIGLMEGGMPPRGLRGMKEGRDSEQMAILFEHILNEVEIQLPGDEDFERFMLSELAGTGFEIRSGMKGDYLTYEMKVPMKSDETHPYALGEGGIHSVTLEIETPEIDRAAMRARMSERGGEDGFGGMGGRGGGMRPGGGPPRGGQRPDFAEALKVSFKVNIER